MYFTGKWRDFGGSGQTLPEYRTKGTVCVIIIDAEEAIEDKFWVTPSHAIITRFPVDSKLILYILDNNLKDPLSNPLYSRSKLTLTEKKVKVEPGGPWHQTNGNKARVPRPPLMLGRTGTKTYGRTGAK